MTHTIAPLPRILCLCAITSLMVAAPLAKPAAEQAPADTTISQTSGYENAGTGGLVMVGGLSEQDRQLADRAEQWLNNVTTMTADFAQISQNGYSAQGKFLLSRPGKLRFEYSFPNTDFITTTGTLKFHWDSEAEQESSTLVSTTPAAILLEEDVKLEEQARIRSVETIVDEVHITLTDPVDTDEPTGALLTLVFDTDFTRLKRWRIEDAGGNVTETHLRNIVYGTELPTKLFVFDKPKKRDPFDRNNR
ncbi:MAG: hypothetical protein Alpg2KO_14170 [Alphaproteobacteria bacterium]